MIRNNIFKNDDGKPMDIENRDTLLIEYGTILERMRNNARECAKGYEDYLRMSWGIEATVRFDFNDTEKDLVKRVLQPHFCISFKTEEDKEMFLKLEEQKKKLEEEDKKKLEKGGL